MSEVIAIKTLNGHPLVDTEARAEIEALKSGGSASAGGGSGAFIINASCDSNDTGTEYTNAVKDKTIAEISAAYANGESLELRLTVNGGMFAGATLVYPNYMAMNMGDVSAFMFSHWSTVMPNLITFMPDDTISVLLD